MDYKDYYQIMGLSKGATADEIKQAYRKLARKYHPDVSKEENAEAKFKELGEAYEVLHDPEKRTKYDQYGQYWKEQGQGYNPGANTHYRDAYDDSQAAGFEDFINSIFRERAAQGGFYDQGRDIHASLVISLEDSFHGAEKTLQLQIPSVDRQGHMQYQTRSVKVKIPKGIADKQQIRLKGQGGQTANRPAGDLYIEINLHPHAWFQVQDKDIYLQVPVAPWEAALGATIEVPTLAGPVKVTLPKLSQTGKKMRLKGRGLPGKEPGDQFLTLQIVIPQKENPEADKLYKQLAQTLHFNPREKLGVSNG
ncbi:MAG: DnaJ C-terminal domain-containing protein [Tatlockia sp.]|jgi:curved DNA-binding protein